MFPEDTLWGRLCRISRDFACLDLHVCGVHYNLQTQAHPFVPSHRQTQRIASLCLLTVACQVKAHVEHTGCSLHPSSPHLYIVLNGLSPHALVAIAIAMIQRVNAELDFANPKRGTCSLFSDSYWCFVHVVNTDERCKTASYSNCMHHCLEVHPTFAMRRLVSMMVSFIVTRL